MNTKILQIAAIVLITLAVLIWLRSDGRYDFDLRETLPFLRGKVTLHDWGSLAIIALGLWGLGRLRRLHHRDTPAPPDELPTDPWRTPRPPSPWHQDDHE